MTMRECQPRPGKERTYSVDGCTTEPITMAYCEGNCASRTHYNEDLYFTHDCTCCQHNQYTNVTHQAMCADGTTVRNKLKCCQY